MTAGIGVLYKNGIVLAADSLVLKEGEEIAREDAQKLFQLDSSSGIVISGCTPFDPCDTENLIDMPVKRSAERLRRSPPDLRMRRHVLLEVLVKEVKSYLSKSATEHPEEICRIDVILGDFDRDRGYLLLECQFEYNPSSDFPISNGVQCQEISEIYEMFAGDNSDFVVKCFGGNSPIRVFGIGVMGGEELVEKYPQHLNPFLNRFFPPRLDDAVGHVSKLIDQIAQEYQTVNNRVQIAVIDENGYQVLNDAVEHLG